jgi:hypothetical protein
MGKRRYGTLRRLRYALSYLATRQGRCTLMEKGYGI